MLPAVAGIACFCSLGQLEDPEPSFKTTVTAKPGPGASTRELEHGMTGKIELMARYRPDALLLTGERLRRKIRDIETRLPPGVGHPIINSLQTQNRVADVGDEGVRIAPYLQQDVNMSDVGKAVGARIEDLTAIPPHGTEIERVHWQSDDVGLVVTSSLTSLGQAVAIVLTDQSDDKLSNEQRTNAASINAGAPRLRPEVLATAATMLGVFPPLPDVFRARLAVIVTGSVTVGTILTMLLGSVFFATVGGIREKTPCNKQLLEPEAK